MKKVFSLILAVAMVLSLASVAFAVADFKPWTEKSSSSSKDALPVETYDNTAFYTYKDHALTKVDDGKTTFGTTIYFPLFVKKGVIATQDKSIASLNLSYVIEEGSAYVGNVSIVKKYVSKAVTDLYAYDEDGTETVEGVKVIDRKYSGYFIAVETKGSATGNKNISGVVSLTGKTGSGSIKLKDETVHFAVELYWTDAFANGEGDYVFDTNEVAGQTMKYDKMYLVTGKNEETEFEFNDDTTFTVEMVAGEKVTIKYNQDVIKSIEDANEEAGISFMNFNNTTFKRSGDLLINADEDEPGYLYEINADNTLKNISATYNEEEGGFFFKAKKLTRYCLSDLPLVDAEGTVAAAPGAVNPVTGAIA